MYLRLPKGYHTAGVYTEDPRMVAPVFINLR